MLYRSLTGPNETFQQLFDEIVIRNKYRYTVLTLQIPYDRECMGKKGRIPA